MPEVAYNASALRDTNDTQKMNIRDFSGILCHSFT